MISLNKYNYLPGIFKICSIISFLGILYVSFSSFNLFAHKTNDYNRQITNVVTQWYDLFLKLESKDINAYPPLSAERLAKMSLAGYLAHDMFKNEFENQSPNSLHLINEVYANAVKQIFLSSNVKYAEDIEKLRTRINKQEIGNHGNLTLVIKAIESKLNDFQLGVSAANCETSSEIYAAVHDDYAFISNAPVLPLWGKKPTYTLDKSSIKLQKPFTEYNTFYKGIYKDALEIYTKSMHLTKEEKWIAEFWSDDVRGLTFSPAGRWVAITNQIVTKENLTPNELFELYLRLCFGMNDASVICWYGKYLYNLERPSSFINKHINADWKPLHPNPEFPSYPSGHAVLGATAATILEGKFGTHYSFTDDSHRDRLEFFSEERSFKTINEMAVENALSRILMGVHYKADCRYGLLLGYQIGKIVNAADIRGIIYPPADDKNHSLSSVLQL